MAIGPFTGGLEAINPTPDVNGAIKNAQNFMQPFNNTYQVFSEMKNKKEQLAEEKRRTDMQNAQALARLQQDQSQFSQGMDLKERQFAQDTQMNQVRQKEIESQMKVNELNVQIKQIDFNDKTVGKQQLQQAWTTYSDTTKDKSLEDKMNSPEYKQLIAATMNLDPDLGVETLFKNQGELAKIVDNKKQTETLALVGNLASSEYGAALDSIQKGADFETSTKSLMSKINSMLAKGLINKDSLEFIQDKLINPLKEAYTQKNKKSDNNGSEVESYALEGSPELITNPQEALQKAAVSGASIYQQTKGGKISKTEGQKEKEKTVAELFEEMRNKRKGK